MAYRKKERATGWTRIELLLALYDKALERLNRADADLAARNEFAATQQLIQIQLILTSLAAGVCVELNPEQGNNILRLYSFVSNELRTPRAEGIASARKILGTLREGFEAIREEANQLERSGRLKAADSLQAVHVIA
jgi:flagellin-specific chaperone FliS